MASYLIASVVVSLIATLGGVDGYVVSAARPQRFEKLATKFDITILNRTLCQSYAEVPPNRVNTTSRLFELRQLMVTNNLDAYLVVMTDEHGAYSGTGHDARVAYISGFSGSNGWAVVTRNEAALWTDGRYFLQADQQMDCQWLLMKMGVSGYPQNTWDWLKGSLQPGSKVGAYQNIISQSLWQSHVSGLNNSGIDLVPVQDEFIDLIWTSGRPAKSNNPLIVHTIDFAGETWESKLGRIRAEVANKQAEVLVVTVLEQVAWSFNLRGSDKSSSLFYGYAIVYPNNASLYIRNVTGLNTEEIQSHLKVSATGSCIDASSVNCINIFEYDLIYDHIGGIDAAVTIWVDPSANQAIYAAATDGRAVSYVATSPIELMKSIKNEVERGKFAECILRDSAAVVEYAAFLEKEIAAGRSWTEITGANKLDSIRANYTYNMGLSFETISAFGPNAAVIHYRPEPETESTIDTSSVYLLDSGGQYLDGTTDVTRTFHYGTPTDAIKEAYTRVLMGQIDLATSVWPEGLYGYDLDVRARFPLYRHGWDYNHGTGHGIGYFLSVHEGPGRINKGYSSSHEPLYRGMFFSDEPGYYEDGSFGIRLENLVTVVEANTPNQFGSSTYVTFKTLTLVPYEPKLIKEELLSEDQKSWLEEYNRRCLKETGDYLLNERHNQEAYDWIVARTGSLTDELSASATVSAGFIVPIISGIIAVVAALWASERL